MEFNQVINNLLYIILTAIMPIVVPFVLRLIQTKIKESNVIKDLTENELLSNLIKDAMVDVTDAVIYVNQVYVDALKQSGEFTPESQNKAFNRAYIEAINMISNESKRAIEKLYGSFDSWLKSKIEVSVHITKTKRED